MNFFSLFLIFMNCFPVLGNVEQIGCLENLNYDNDIFLECVDTKWCIFECKFIEAPFMVYHDKKCTCMYEVGHLNDLPCTDSESVVFHITDLNLF